MRRIYIAVLVTFVASIILFIGSLVYLDKEKHKIYFYNINLDGHDIGNIRIDKFITDDKLIYKSVGTFPFMPLLTESKSRITLDKRYVLMSYFKDESGSGAQDTVYLENSNNNISFVATSTSEFACLTDLPVKGDVFVFEEDSPVTYLPILENYNFKLGRSQAFNVITSYSTLLPPMKRLLTLTSIRDEYLKIGSRKIKVECLLIKIRNSPQGMLWVTKSGRTMVMVEFPDRKLKITRTFYPKKTGQAKDFALEANNYVSENIKFNNNKIVLAGTITIPKKEGSLPAVLLIGGTDEGDRNSEGLFTYIADTLTRLGYIVLRYDSRGIGSSGGDSRSVTDADEFGDAQAALSYILSRKETDPQRIAVLGHGKGAFIAAKLAGERKDIRALALLGPMVSLGGETDLNFDNLNEMAAKFKWDDQYKKLAIKSRMETIDRVKKTRNNWISLLRTRCFLKRLRDQLDARSIDVIRKVAVPVLILHGKEDELVPAKASATLDKALEESGNANHKLIYYGYLGHFFGKLRNDGGHKLYYQTDEAVLDAINKWLDANLAKIDLTLK